MSVFNFYHPIEVRYGDLDPQGHLNHAKYLTYMEQARINYIKRLGLWDGGSFMDYGIILANVQITFHAPVLFGQQLRVGMRTTRLGTKSLEMEYTLEDALNGHKFATSSSVQVAYDYRSGQTIPIPNTWRQAIKDFENLPE
jgi:acyl-CoA thioester hydrolase